MIGIAASSHQFPCPRSAHPANALHGVGGSCLRAGARVAIAIQAGKQRLDLRIAHRGRVGGRALLRLFPDQAFLDGFSLSGIVSVPGIGLSTGVSTCWLMGASFTVAG